MEVPSPFLRKDEGGLSVISFAEKSKRMSLQSLTYAKSKTIKFQL